MIIEGLKVTQMVGRREKTKFTAQIPSLIWYIKISELPPGTFHSPKKFSFCIGHEQRER